MIKKAENLALAGWIGLLVVAGILLTGGLMYKSVSYWAGMMAALGQALVVGLAWWGLTLARQQEELKDLPAIGGSGVDGGSFRMSYGDDAPATGTGGSSKKAVAGAIAGTMIAGPLGGVVGGLIGSRMQRSDGDEVRTLETGFQRTVVMLTAVLLVILSGVISYFLVYGSFAWAKGHPDKPFPISDPPMDEAAMLIGLGAAAIYVGLWWITKPRRDTAGYGEAVSGNFVLGIGGMVALGGAVVAGFMRVAYAQELAASVIAALLLLQGLELAVNAVRSYARVEELDEPEVDLQALPLVPMISSLWLGGLKMLFAQSLGIAREGQSGVFGRMMPRALVAVVLIGVGVSCIRVVQPGDVAVLERLGQVEGYPDLKAMDAAILQPGLHFTLPWPIDRLVTIPVDRMQSVKVGNELHAMPDVPEKLDFRFWTYRPRGVKEDDEENEFLTGDPLSPQVLETFVGVWWRVRAPAKFYNSLSHSEFIDEDAERKTVQTIYSALIQQSASYAVTKTFAIHTLDNIMTADLIEVSNHCRTILQEKLDEANSGLEIVDLTIKDVHPPLGEGRVLDANVAPDPGDDRGYRLGPADAYEHVISARELKQFVINRAEAFSVAIVNGAKADAAIDKNKAEAYKLEQVSRAEGEAARLTGMLAGMKDEKPATREYMLGLARQQKLYPALREVLPQVTKVIVGPNVEPPQIWQTNEKGLSVPGRMP